MRAADSSDCMASVGICELLKAFLRCDGRGHHWKRRRPNHRRHETTYCSGCAQAFWNHLESTTRVSPLALTPHRQHEISAGQLHNGTAENPPKPAAPGAASEAPSRSKQAPSAGPTHIVDLCSPALQSAAAAAPVLDPHPPEEAQPAIVPTASSGPVPASALTALLHPAHTAGGKRNSSAKKGATAAGDGDAAGPAAVEGGAADAGGKTRAAARKRTSAETAAPPESCEAPEQPVRTKRKYTKRAKPAKEADAAGAVAVPEPALTVDPDVLRALHSEGFRARNKVRMPCLLPPRSHEHLTMSLTSEGRARAATLQ